MRETNVKKKKSGDYYTTKDGPGDWTVHGRRFHQLQITRSEGPTGRVDSRGEDYLQTIFIVRDVLGWIATDDQMDIEPHGFTRLKDAVSYAVDKLIKYEKAVLDDLDNSER
jgi:hypothetical protein